MRYLVDTDTIIDWLKGAPQAAGFRRLLAADELGISIMTHGEVYEGIYFGRDPQAAERTFRQLLRLSRWYPSPAPSCGDLPASAASYVGGARSLATRIYS